MSTTGCVICSQAATAANPIQALRGAYQAGGADPVRLRLCTACLSRRERRSWSLSRPEGARLARALSVRRAAPEQRFTYLAGEDRRLHLVHLRADWAKSRRA